MPTMNTREQRRRPYRGPLQAHPPKDGELGRPEPVRPGRRYSSTRHSPDVYLPGPRRDGVQVQAHLGRGIHPASGSGPTDGTVTETRTIVFTEKKTYKQNSPSVQQGAGRRRSIVCRCCSGPLPGGGRTAPPRLAGSRSCSATMFLSVHGVRRLFPPAVRRRRRRPRRPAAGGGAATSTRCRAYLESAALDSASYKSLVVQSQPPARLRGNRLSPLTRRVLYVAVRALVDEKYGASGPGHDWVKVHWRPA